MTSLVRGIRLILLIWIGLVVFAIVLGFVHQAVQPQQAHRPFDGTTEALKKMRIPELRSDQEFQGFQPDKHKIIHEEKPR